MLFKATANDFIKFSHVDQNFSLPNSSPSIAQMKATGRSRPNYVPTARSSTSKVEKPSKTDKSAKSKALSKQIETEKPSKRVPTKGLEVEDDDESDFDLDKELEEEYAHNELVQHSAEADGDEDEDEVLVLHYNSNVRRMFSRDLNPKPRPMLQSSKNFLPSQRTGIRSSRKKLERLLPLPRPPPRVSQEPYT